MKKWQEEDSVQHLHSPGRPKVIRFSETTMRARDAIQNSPKRSMRRHSITLDISRGTLQRIVRCDLKLLPYKIQVVQQLADQDGVVRKKFCVKFLELVENPGFLDSLLMSDDFYLNGFVNKQNYRYWAPHNPREIHQKPLHGEKLL